MGGPTLSTVKAATKPPAKAPLPDTHEEEIKQLQEELNIKLEEWHCGGCGRFLLLYAILEGTVVKRCRRCKKVNVLHIHELEIVKEP